MSDICHSATCPQCGHLVPVGRSLALREYTRLTDEEAHRLARLTLDDLLALVREIEIGHAIAPADEREVLLYEAEDLLHVAVFVVTGTPVCWPSYSLLGHTSGCPSQDPIVYALLGELPDCVWDAFSVLAQPELLEGRLVAARLAVARHAAAMLLGVI